MCLYLNYMCINNLMHNLLTNKTSNRVPNDNLALAPPRFLGVYNVHLQLTWHTL